MKTKEQLRREVGDRRTALDPGWVRKASSRIVARLQGLDAYKSAKCIALYKAIAGEVDLENLFSTCWNSGKRTCVPVFNCSQNAYEMAETGSQTRYSRGNHGIQEPENASLVPVGDVDLIIVPGVAFDNNGNRLGRGGGYYDRILEGFCGVKAAVAFEFQLFADIPHETNDIPVNCIVTESKVYDVCNEH